MLVDWDVMYGKGQGHSPHLRDHYGDLQQPTEENMGGRLCLETLFARSKSTYDEANWGRVHHHVHVSVPGNGFADEGGVDVVSYDFVSELPRYNNEVTSTSKETLQADGENKWQLDPSLMGLQMLSG